MPKSTDTRCGAPTKKITVEYLHGAELYQSVVVVKVTNAQEQTLGVVRLPRK